MNSKDMVHLYSIVEFPNKHSRVHFQSDVTARGGIELHTGGAQSAEDTSKKN
jgi:hypothetical protein